MPSQSTPTLIDVFAAARHYSDFHSPYLEQAVMTDFIVEGHFERHIRRMRAIYHERQVLLVNLARERFGSLLDVRPADAGMTVIGWLGAGLDDITTARAAMQGAHTPEQKFAAGNQMDGALGRLLVVVENYPQIKSQENFLHLQDELAGTENRLAVARKRYNDVVRDFNVMVRSFPTNIFAGMFNFQAQPFYEVAPEARQVPKVSFPAAPNTQPAPSGGTAKPVPAGGK